MSTTRWSLALISSLAIGGGGAVAVAADSAARKAIIRPAEVYIFDGLVRHDVEKVRAVLASDAFRLENGINTGQSGSDIAERMLKPVFKVIRGAENLRWTVDVGNGEAFVLYDLVTARSTTPTLIAERFKVVDGRITEIEAVFNAPADSIPVCEVVEEIPCTEE